MFKIKNLPAKSIVVISACMIAVSGCSSSATPGTTTGEDSPSPQSSGQDGLPYGGAPKVDHPINDSTLTKFRKDPCAMVTPKQLDKLGITETPEPTPDDPIGPYCTVSDLNGRTGVTFSMSIFKDQHGLSSAYKAGNKDFDAINGFPAAKSDTDSAGECQIAVGVRDTQMISFGIKVRGGANPAKNFDKPCGVAKIVAEQAVTTLQNSR